jgi:hypothetical protein
VCVCVCVCVCVRARVRAIRSPVNLAILEIINKLGAVPTLRTSY